MCDEYVNVEGTIEGSLILSHTHASCEVTFRNINAHFAIMSCFQLVPHIYEHLYMWIYVCNSCLKSLSLSHRLQVLQAAAMSCREAQLAPDSIATQTAVQLDPLDSFTTHNTSPGRTARGPRQPPPGKGMYHGSTNTFKLDTFELGLTQDTLLLRSTHRRLCIRRNYYSVC